MDCTQTRCDQFGVSGYPTLKLFFDGEEVGEYQGQRRAQFMKQFIDQRVEEYKARGSSQVVSVSNEEEV